jgi:hypothetical protein
LLLLQYCSLFAKSITIKEGIPSKQDAKVCSQGKFNQTKSYGVPSKRNTQIAGARKPVHDNTIDFSQIKRHPLKVLLFPTVEVAASAYKIEHGVEKHDELTL